MKFTKKFYSPQLAWGHSILLLLSLCLFACEGVTEGKKAPDFKLKDLEGKTHQLSEYEGKVVLLHFWTDYCKACKAEFPKLQESYQNLQSKDFELVAVNVGQPLAASKKFQKAFKVTFPMLADTKGFTQTLYKLEGYPTNYVLSPEGKITQVQLGWASEQQIKIWIKEAQK